MVSPTSGENAKDVLAELGKKAFWPNSSFSHNVSGSSCMKKDIDVCEKRYIAIHTQCIRLRRFLPTPNKFPTAVGVSWSTRTSTGSHPVRTSSTVAIAIVDIANKPDRSRRMFHKIAVTYLACYRDESWSLASDTCFTVTKLARCIIAPYKMAATQH